MNKMSELNLRKQLSSASTSTNKNTPRFQRSQNRSFSNKSIKRSIERNRSFYIKNVSTADNQNLQKLQIEEAIKNSAFKNLRNNLIHNQRTKMRQSQSKYTNARQQTKEQLQINEISHNQLTTMVKELISRTKQLTTKLTMKQNQLNVKQNCIIELEKQLQKANQKSQSIKFLQKQIETIRQTNSQLFEELNRNKLQLIKQKIDKEQYLKENEILYDKIVELERNLSQSNKENQKLCIKLDETKRKMYLENKNLEEKKNNKIVKLNDQIKMLKIKIKQLTLKIVKNQFQQVNQQDTCSFTLSQEDCSIYS